MLEQIIKRCTVYPLHLKTAFSVQSEWLSMGEGSEFYWRHADPSVKYLFSLTVSHLFYHLKYYVKH